MNRTLFYLFMLIGPSIWGLYVAKVLDGEPDQLSVLILVAYSIVIGALRKKRVGVPIISFELSPIKKLKRLKKIFFSK